jgi:F0F1-type ATP synthase membrane subunit c/vacuolar-type H+-ATPase subunit K
MINLEVMDEVQTRLTRLRRIRSVLIGFVIISAFLAELQPGGNTNPWSVQQSLMAGLAIVCVLEGFHFRRRLVTPAASAIAAGARNPQVVKRWEIGQLICMAMAGATVMYGLVVCTVFHGSLWQALPFYSLGAFLLQLWSPKASIKPA